MSKIAIPEWAKRPMFKTRVNTPVNTQPTVNTGDAGPVNTSKDRHRPGYMAEYMRKRRERLKAGSGG